MSEASQEAFAPWLVRWGLVRDGEPIRTHASRLLPVLRGGTPAMLKLSAAEEEPVAGALMAWWDGDGAARVLDPVFVGFATGRHPYGQFWKDYRPVAW